MGCTQAAHGQDCTEPGWDGLGGGSEGGRERGRLRPDAGRGTSRRTAQRLAATGVRGGTADDHRASGEDRRGGPALAAPVARTAGSPTRCLSLDDLMDGGWQPAGTGLGMVEGPGPVVATVLDALVAAGWDRANAADAIAIMADHAGHDRAGTPTTRWRWVSLRLGVPQWQARRLALLLLGVMAGRASSSSSSARARRSSGIRPCGGQCSRPPRDGPQARAPGWPAGTPAWRGSHEWSSAGVRRRIAHAVGIRFGAAGFVAYHTRVHLPVALTHMRRVGRYAGCVGVYDGGGAMRAGARCAEPLPTGIACHHGPRRSDADPRGTTMTTTPSPSAPLVRGLTPRQQAPAAPSARPALPGLASPPSAAGAVPGCSASERSWQLSDR